MKDPLDHDLVDTPPMPGIRCRTPMATWDLFEIARIEASFAGCTHSAFAEHAQHLGLLPLCKGSPFLSNWAGLRLLVIPPRPEDVSRIIDKLLQTQRTFDTDVVCLTPRTEATRYLDEDLGIDTVTLITSPIRFPRPWMLEPYPHTWLIEWREHHDDL